METMQQMVEQTKDVEDTLKKTMEIVQYEFEQKLDQTFPTTDKLLEALAKQQINPMKLVSQMRFRQVQKQLQQSEQNQNTWNNDVENSNNMNPEELRKQQELTLGILKETLTSEQNAALGKLLAESAAKPIQATSEKINNLTEDLSQLQSAAEKQKTERDQHLKELKELKK
jgi:hypothetical protein